VDLLRISQKLWRYRFVTLPVIALTLLGAFYVVAIKAPVYKVSSSWVLINPPPPPTADEIARNPALGRVNPNNPYTRFSDQSVIVSLLSSSLSNDAARQQLKDSGADPRYTVAPDVELGYSSLVLQITGVGSTPESAVNTAELVGGALTRQLNRVQTEQHVDPSYMIKAQQVVAPNSPKQQISSKLRPLIAVFAIGAILLLLTVSAAEALGTLRTEWRGRDLRGDSGEGDVIGGAANGNGMGPRTDEVPATADKGDPTMGNGNGNGASSSSRKKSRASRKKSRGRQRKTTRRV
jgi:hypothetical protein